MGPWMVKSQMFQADRASASLLKHDAWLETSSISQSLAGCATTCVNRTREVTEQAEISKPTPIGTLSDSRSEPNVAKDTVTPKSKCGIMRNDCSRNVKSQSIIGFS